MPPGRVTPFRDLQSRLMAGALGMKIFLVSLGVLFAASLIGFAVVRIQHARAWPQLPPLPQGLWVSTLIIVASSATMQIALTRARAGHAARTPLLITTALGVGFLLAQAICWIDWLDIVTSQWSEFPHVRFALASFYILSGIHALHVLGGLVPMTFVTLNACRGRFAPMYFPAVHYVGMYWHFLGLVWLVLFIVLLTAV